LKPRLPLYEPLTHSDVRTIAAAAFEVLEKSGLLVYSPSALRAFEAAGATVDQDSQLVRLPRSLVEDAIASNPSSVTLYGRDERHHVVLDRKSVHYGTGGTALYVLDPDSHKRRRATVEDVKLNARLVQVLDHIDLFTINVFPNEIKRKEDIDVNRFFHSFDNTTKHVMGGAYSLEGCRKVVKMAELIAGSPHHLRTEPFLSLITLIISPFKIDEVYGEMTCYFAQEGLPVVVPAEPICGTTSPVTLAGNVLTHVAETLGGIALVQSVRKGAPGICGSVGSIPNLRTLDHLGGAVERGMINAAVAQVTRYFDLPLYSTAGASDAKEMDIQAAYEGAITNLLVGMSGADYIHDAAGLTEFDLTVSYEKLVADNEIIGMCKRVLRGIEVDDDKLGLDLILQKGPGKDFLGEEHTVRHMRGEFFMPKLANRQKRRGYDESHGALARARAVVNKVRSREHRSCIRQRTRSRILSSFAGIRVATHPCPSAAGSSQKAR
jgi:trimethylamine--corrinoid protein Co-methyltransferase